MFRIDIRIYDALTGRLKKVFNDIHDEKSIVDLSCLCFGGKQRKFYIADNSGLFFFLFRKKTKKKNDLGFQHEKR